ncbi:MAG: Ig-like domain-containing protein, partial [Candidatus Binatota bacterium]
VAITAPTTSAAYGTSSTSLSLGGTAADNVGVTQVSWSNDRGGSGTATGTTTWSASGIALQRGANVLTVTARDAAGNTGTATLTVTFTDTTAPTVAITAPTTSATYSTSSSSLALGGTAADNVAVTQVTWSNDRGGSGTATGTNTWTASGIALQPGANVLTVTARDAAGNTGTATLTVTYTDTTPPTVAITSPTSAATYATGNNSLALGGTASDNVGVTQVTWTNDRGGSGTATGTTTWSATGIALQLGANVLTVTARDAAGNTATARLTVTFTDTTAPTVAITAPTASATYSTSSTSVALGGTAADNVGITQVTWSNDRGGSGTATGTTTWSASGIALQPGANVLTVTARDAAGNTATDT